MRKIFFTTILLFLALGQAVAATLVQGEKLYADVHDCGTWYNESSTDFRLWYGEGESDYVDVEGSVEAGFLWSCDVERDDISRVQLKRVDPSNHSTVWNWSDIFDVESGKDVLKLGENCDGGCKWKTCTWYATTPIYVTPSTLTYTNSATWDPETKTLKANVKVGDNPDRWMTREMTFTGKTYSGEDIYSCKLYCLYGGVHVVQFQVYNGETQEGLKEYDKEGTFTDCWSNIQNKIYNGTSWLTFGRDITFYAIPEATSYAFATAFDVSTHTLYANFKYGSSGSEWTDPKPTMSKTIYKFNGNWIYEVIVLAPYNVIKQIQFQVYNGVSYIEEYQYDGGDCGNSTRCDLSNVTADDIDGKIFGGWVNEAHTWYDYAPDTYTVEEHNNGGRIWEDSVGSYTFGVGATLPTNVTKWGYDFAGWYANSSFDGEPVTIITTTDTGNKEYYAKWTSILKEYPVASHPEFLAVQEGDIIVVNVTSVQTSSKIYLYDLNYTEIENRDIASTGKHIFHLNAAAATNIRNYGFFVAGNNFTFDDVEIRYRKTIWTGPLNAEDNWKEEAVDKSIFSGLSEGDFLGFDISKINTGEYHQYSMRADYDNVLAGSCTETGIAIHQLSAADITALTDSDRIDIVAQYLEIAHLYAYSGIFVIYRTGDAPDGGIETFAGGTINTPIEYRMKVRELDQWYSLSLPFTVSAVQVIEDGVHYDIVPYYRPTIGGTYYLGHYVIRTPAKTSDFPIKDFGDWRDPNNYDVLPSKNTPYIILWHDSYFYDKYVAFIGAAGQTIPTAMTEGDRPTKDSVVNVYGNDAMISGSVVDAYTFEADYGHGSWLREETIGDSRMIPPFESYLRANAATTPIFKVVRKEDTTTGIDPTSYDPSAHANKVLINGQVVIVKDNKMYNILGMEIQ